MINSDFIGLLLPAAVGTVTGLLLGRVYFVLLWRSAERHVVGGRPLEAAMALVLRLLAAGGVLWLLATWRSAALLGGLAGFTLARLLFKVRAEVGTP